MPAPPSSSQTAAKNAASASKSSASRSASGTNSHSGSSASKGTSSSAGRAPGASAAAAKASAAASAAKNAASKGRSQTAGRVPGTSQAAAKNTAMGRVAEAAKQNPGYNFSGNQNEARISAVRRGPGVISGALPGSTNALAQRRTLTALGNSIVENPTFRTRYSLGALNTLPKAVIGEARNEGDMGRAAVANVMMNRLALGINDPRNYGYFGAGSIPRMMRGIDAAGVDPNRPSLRPNAGYRNTRPGTSDYADGLRAVADSLSPYSEFSQNATPRTLAATHYYNPSISNPKWGEARSGTPFDTIGNHVFGNAERTAGQVASLRNGPPINTQLASAVIGSIPRPVPRPANLRTPVPRPTPRPDSFPRGFGDQGIGRTVNPYSAPPGLAQNPYDATPPGAYSGYGNFSPPAITAGINPPAYASPYRGAYGGYGNFSPPQMTAGLERAAYDTNRAGQYSGYGAFSTPNRTAGLEQAAYGGPPASKYSGYGAFASLPPAKQEPPRLTPTMPKKEPMGHWRREETNYLNQIGALPAIMADPYARLGYAEMMGPYGLRLNNETRPYAFGSYVPDTGALSVKTGVVPQQYGATLAHELGHVGSYKMNNGYPQGFAQEEVRQRMVDAKSGLTEAQRLDALGQLQNPQLRSGMGMAFTPPLPGPQKQTYDRVPQMPGPMPQYGLPERQMSPFGNVGQEYHEHTAPPTPSQYRNEMPPAAPHPGTPMSQTAEVQTEDDPSMWEGGPNLLQQGGAWLNAKVEQAKPYVQKAGEGAKQIADAREHPIKNMILNAMLGGGGSKAPPSDIGSDLRVPPAAYASAPPPAATSEAIPPRVELIALLDRMRQAGATPEEIAFVEDLATQAA